MRPVQLAEQILIATVFIFVATYRVMSFDWHILIPSTVGGLVTGTFAILATWFTYKHTIRLHQRQQQKKLNGLLMAIRYEIDIAIDILQRKAGHLLDKLEEGKPYLNYFSLSGEYFIIYPNNTELIGQIDDRELCKAIIETYNTANYAIEGLRVNNWYLERLSDFRKLQGQHSNANYISTNIQSLEKHLVEYAPALKKGNQVLKEQKQNLLSRIGDYLKRHGYEE